MVEAVGIIRIASPLMGTEKKDTGSRHLLRVQMIARGMCGACPFSRQVSIHPIDLWSHFILCPGPEICNDFHTQIYHASMGLIVVRNVMCGVRCTLSMSQTF